MSYVIHAIFLCVTFAVNNIHDIFQMNFVCTLRTYRRVWEVRVRLVWDLIFSLLPQTSLGGACQTDLGRACQTSLGPHIFTTTPD